ncbi:hypothetical protein EVAR_2310_1 [Eumeta japonica]|uniref:Uncharacterized protein n=1 Tax=Eumeta variegata TaxID=151549 RepID=A0A4C1SI36_EUMVA|nr:hypothetical protein EVAR_2310_1 [Eumeta japonica]
MTGNPVAPPLDIQLARETSRRETPKWGHQDRPSPRLGRPVRPEGTAALRHMSIFGRGAGFNLEFPYPSCSAPGGRTRYLICRPIEPIRIGISFPSSEQIDVYQRGERQYFFKS